MDLDVFHPFPTQLTIIEGRSGNGGGEIVLRKGHIHKDDRGRTCNGAKSPDTKMTSILFLSRNASLY